MANSPLPNGRFPTVLASSLADLGFLLLMGLIATTVSELLGVVNAVTVAALAGLAARNLGALAPDVAGRLARWTSPLMRTGIVLFGTQLTLARLGSVPFSIVPLVIVTVAVTFGFALLISRRLRLAPGTGLLVATGFSICGAAAAVAMKEVSRSKEEDLVAAVALVTVFGGLMIFLLPLVNSYWIHFPPVTYGYWAGASVHEVAQVVAAAAPLGTSAVEAATIAKLLRILLLAPLLAGYGMWLRRRGELAGGNRPPLVPWFVWGCLGVGLMCSAFALPEALLGFLSQLTAVLFASSLFALGAAVDLRLLRRTATGALTAGLMITAVAATVSAIGLSWS